MRGLGLSVNQALHLPGAGDFVLDQINGPTRPEPAGGLLAKRSRQVDAMDAESAGPVILATAEKQRRQALQRENMPDPLDAEQTWPTEEVRHALVSSIKFDYAF